VEIGTRKGFNVSLDLGTVVGGRNGLSGFKVNVEGFVDTFGGVGRKGFNVDCSLIGERDGRW